MSEIENTKNIERLLDVEMGVTVRFGATKVPLRDVVNFGNGSMIELNRMVDEPVELLVNNFPFARGEVVVIDGYYSVKITEIESTEKRSNTFFPQDDAGKEVLKNDVDNKITEEENFAEIKSEAGEMTPEKEAPNKRKTEEDIQKKEVEEEDNPEPEKED